MKKKKKKRGLWIRTSWFKFDSPWLGLGFLFSVSSLCFRGFGKWESGGAREKREGFVKMVFKGLRRQNPSWERAYYKCSFSFLFFFFFLKKKFILNPSNPQILNIKKLKLQHILMNLKFSICWGLFCFFYKCEGLIYYF